MTEDPLLLLEDLIPHEMQKLILDHLNKVRIFCRQWKAVEYVPVPRVIDHDALSFFDLLLQKTADSRREFFVQKIVYYTFQMRLLYCQNLTSLISEEEQPPRIGGRKVADAIVVSAVILLSIVYLYLVGCIDRGGSKAGSSGSLVFRDIYISIVLFQAAYVWIKFRGVIPRKALYCRPGSNKWEPRIKFPVIRGVTGRSKRIPLGSFDTSDEAEVAYQIAAFYCKKRKHPLGRLDLGGGASFPIPALSVDPNLPYEEKVKQVGDQVLRVHAEFELQKASMNVLPPRVPGLALEMPTGEGQLLPTAPIQQLRQLLNSGMESALQGHGSQLGPNIPNGDDFNNRDYLLLLLAKAQHKLFEAEEQNEYLKAQVSRTEVENKKLKQRNSELECEIGLSNQQITQLHSQLQPLHEEPNFYVDMFLNTELEESLAR